MMRAYAVAAIGVATLGTAASLVAATAPAQAAVKVTCPVNQSGPTTKLIDDSHAEVYCISGGGNTYQAWVKCTGSTTEFLGGVESYTGSTPSFVSCPRNKFVTSGGMLPGNGDPQVTLKVL